MSKPLICYVHIEKAGGTTLHSILRNNYLSYFSLRPWFYWTNEEQNVLKQDEASLLFKKLWFVKGFGGHSLRSYLKYEEVLKKKIFYITFLREPISRYISHYNYQKNVMNIDWKFEDFLNESKFDNFMTKRIAGAYNIEHAKIILEKNFSFVGILEKYDESLLLFKKLINDKNFKVHYVKQREAKTKITLNNVDSYKNVIEEKNKLDIELYDFATKILDYRIKENYGLNFEKELKEFKLENSNYSPPKNILKKIFRIYLKRYMLATEQKVHKQFHL